MSRPVVTEFAVPESEHHRFDLLAEVFASDMAIARQHQARAQEADRIARTKLTQGCGRILTERLADKLEGGVLPQGGELTADFTKRTITLRVQPRAEVPKVPTIQPTSKGKGRAERKANKPPT